MTAKIPERTFIGAIGDESEGTKGPEAIRNDIDEIICMFNPAGEHADDSPGGIDGLNMKEKTITDRELADDAVTDDVIGDRTFDENIADEYSKIGTLTQHLSWLWKYIMSITGAEPFVAVADTIANMKSLLTGVINALATHKTSADHDGRYYTETEIDEMEITAERVTAEPVATDSGSTVQAILAWLKDQIYNVVLDQVPDDSINNAKLGTDVKVGSLAELTTAIKTSVVAAMNSIVSVVSGISTDLDTHKAEKATDEKLGHVMADGETTTIDENGVIRSHSPVQILQEVISFDEEGITVTHNNTKVNDDGNIELSLVEVLGTKAERTADDDGSIAARNTEKGLIIKANTDLLGIKVTTSSNTSVGSGVKIYDQSTGDMIKQVATTITPNKTIELKNIDSPLLLSGKEYRVVIYHNTAFSVGSYAYPSDALLPYTSTDVDILDGVEGTTAQGFTMGFKAVQAIKPQDALSGSTTVKWSSIPTLIRAWDLVTYQNTEDGETVTIDVIDASDDSVLFASISQNFDISTISKTINPGLKINLSRASAANNPTCNYLARRLVR